MTERRYTLTVLKIEIGVLAVVSLGLFAAPASAHITYCQSAERGEMTVHPTVLAGHVSCRTAQEVEGQWLSGQGHARGWKCYAKSYMINCSNGRNPSTGSKRIGGRFSVRSYETCPNRIEVPEEYETREQEVFALGQVSCRTAERVIIEADNNEPHQGWKCRFVEGDEAALTGYPSYFSCTHDHARVDGVFLNEEPGAEYTPSRCTSAPVCKELVP